MSGSERLAVRSVAVGKSTVSGLPGGYDSTAWDADELRVVVDYLERLQFR